VNGSAAEKGKDDATEQRTTTEAGLIAQQPDCPLSGSGPLLFCACVLHNRCPAPASLGHRLIRSAVPVVRHDILDSAR